MIYRQPLPSDYERQLEIQRRKDEEKEKRERKEHEEYVRRQEAEIRRKQERDERAFREQERRRELDLRRQQERDRRREEEEREREERRRERDRERTIRGVKREGGSVIVPLILLGAGYYVLKSSGFITSVQKQQSLNMSLQSSNIKNDMWKPLTQKQIDEIRNIIKR